MSANYKIEIKIIVKLTIHIYHFNKLILHCFYLLYVSCLVVITHLMMDHLIRPHGLLVY